MKKLKKTLLVVLTLLLCLTDVSTVLADDGNQENNEPEVTYSAVYEFVLQEGGELPDEVMKLLPETTLKYRPM